MKTKIVMILFFIISICLKAAWVNDIPVRLTQPDGTQIEAYRSGDEFHNWVHDSSGMTIMKDEKTAYWCWAIEKNGDLVSTGNPIHLYTAESQDIKPFQNISVERYNETRIGWEVPNHLRENTRTPTTGEINNIVIFIRFSDDDEFTVAPSFYDALFNNEGQNVNSMKQYFWDASYQQLTVNSIYYPVPGNTIISYQSTNPRAYYRPYHAIDNPIGYTGGNHGTERTYREHTLLQSAVNAVSSQIPTTLNIDADDDGFVDNVCFMIRGDNDEWAELLWPHRWVLYSYNVFINGKRVYDYNFNLEDFTNIRGVGVLAHEFTHSLSSPDYYRYTGSGFDPVWQWDLMASDLNPPQSMSAHTKYKYLGWIANIPLITTAGIYTLNPVSTHQNGSAYRINSSSSSEHYIVEYRSTSASFIDANLPGSGLIVYRVNPSLNGNADGPPDELYVYRPDGTTNINGQLHNAYYSLESGRTAINNTTNPTPFLANGQPGGLDITNIGSAGATISFQINFEAVIAPPTDLVGIPSDNWATLSWQLPENTDITNIAGYKVYRSSNPTTGYTPITETISNLSYTDNYVINENIYYYRVTTLYISPDEESTPSNVIQVKPGTNELYIGHFNSPTFYNYSFVNYYYRDSISQTIYLESQLTPGTIYQMDVHFTGTPILVPPNINVQVYLATTTQDEFVNNNNWIPFDQFTQVYNAPLPVNNAGTYDVNIVFNTPFEYEGENLAVLIIKDDNTWYGQNNTFQFTEISNYNRTIYWHHDQNPPTTNPYPAANGRLTGFTNARFHIEQYISETIAERPSNWGTPDVGTENNPYLISSLANLRWLSEVPEDWWIDPNTLVYFTQTEDIDASETISWNDGVGFRPIGYFTTIINTTASHFVGVYDGDGHIISDLYINIETTDRVYAGLFGLVRNYSTIRNLGMINTSIHSEVDSDSFTNNVGAIAGFLYFHSLIENCYSTGEINGSGSYMSVFAGGITGDVADSTILNSYSDCNVNSTVRETDSNSGGIIGRAVWSIIENCYSTGNISSSNGGDDLTRSYAGGIGGMIANSSTVINCYSTGNINTLASGDSMAGGIAGRVWFNTDIINCYSTSEIIGRARAGGITGYLQSNSSISDSYFTGNITVSGNNFWPFVGGIAGISHQASIENCYSTGDISISHDTISSHAGGIAGLIDGNSTNSSTISNSYSTGNITNNTIESPPYTGGIVGKMVNVSYVSFSYASGNINSSSYSFDYTGGIAGYAEENSYFAHNLWDIETTGQEYASYDDTPITNLGLPTFEMKQPENYINNIWNFSDIWTHNLDHNFGYPYLQNVPDVVISYRPQNLEGEQIENIVNLSWEAPLPGSTGFLDRYNIYRNGEFFAFTMELSFSDNDFDLEIENTYYITAVYLSPNGESAASNIITTTAVSCDDEIALPYITSLKGNYPNPFNPETNIKFSLAHESNLRIDIYNIKGQKVLTLVDDIYPAGEYNVVWKGKDDMGRDVGSGVYFYRMQAGEYVGVGKMVMMK